MRFMIAAAATILAYGLTDVRPANAAWECMGPPKSCEGAATTKKTHTAKYQGKAKQTASYKKHKSSGSSYSGGGSYSGMASYYWQPQRVASGGWFNPNAMTAAHKTLPFGTVVRVTNLRNGKSVTVKINDRGPYVKGRIIDLSSAAAGAIGMKGSGVAPVSVAVVGS